MVVNAEHYLRILGARNIVIGVVVDVDVDVIDDKRVLGGYVTSTRGRLCNALAGIDESVFDIGENNALVNGRRLYLVTVALTVVRARRNGRRLYLVTVALTVVRARRIGRFRILIRVTRHSRRQHQRDDQHKH